MADLFSALSNILEKIALFTRPYSCLVSVGNKADYVGILINDLVVTKLFAGQVGDVCSVTFSDGSVSAATVRHIDQVCKLAVVQTGRPSFMPPLEVVAPAIGKLAAILSLDSSNAPIMRITTISRVQLGQESPLVTLDFPSNKVDQASIVIDSFGRFIGITGGSAFGDVSVLLPSQVFRVLEFDRNLEKPLQDKGGTRSPKPDMGLATSPRAGLGVALQPIKIPEHLATLTGQFSGRLVVDVSKGSVADKAAIKQGDVLLSVNGSAITGAHAMRAALGSWDGTSPIAVKLLRNGTILTLTI
jgi:hypothetical protein